MSKEERKNCVPFAVW